ncbi:MAG: phosphoglycerate dehydrogenase [Planctomycetota bacterium]
MAATSLDKNKIVFALLEGVNQSAVDLLAAHGYRNVVRHDGALSRAELLDVVSEAHFVGIRSRTRLDESVLREARRLIAVGCFCIGTNQVDLEVARRQGIPVFNAPYANTRSVAELVLGELILLMRGVLEKNMGAHRGEWQKSARNSFEVRGKTLGIIGYGHIGTQVGILAENLGMNVLYHDIESKLSLGNARKADSLEHLLGCSDVVTLHVPDTPLTRQMISTEQLRRMKPGAVLINASRGTVVDIDALIPCLRSGQIRGAAVDVFPTEPKTLGDEFMSPLREFDNVLLTPHVGGSTVEAQEQIGREVAEKLVLYSDNGSTASSVNFPQVALPEYAGKHRLLHIHRNVPGVMARINGVFSDNGVNIASQYLQTDSEIGYVVIDLDQDYSAAAQAMLREIPGTLHCRVLH